MIIDFNAHYGCGPWMSNQVRHGIVCYTPDELLEMERRDGIDSAVVSDASFVFGDKEPDQQSLPEGLVGFAGIRPDFDAGRLRSVRGVRLYPTYQQWDFGGPAMARLMSEASQQGLIVQLCLRFQDPRVLLQKVPSADVIKALDGLTAANASVRFVVTGAILAEIRANSEILARDNIWIDISHIQHPTNCIPKLLGIVDSSRVLFGSNAPMFYPYAAVFRALQSIVSDEDRERILHENARKLLA